MSTIVSEFTTQLTAATSLTGVIAIGFLIMLLLEIEIIRAHSQDKVKNSVIVLRIALIPMALIFLTWMATRFVDLVN